MNNLISFDLLRVNELTVIRHGWFKSWYELTDGQFMYGKLTYMNWLGRKAMLETAGDTWTITPKGAFNRTLFINQAGITTGEINPEIWNRRINIALHSGFKAVFTSKKLWSKVFTLSNDQYGDILNINPNIWKFKTPFRVTFYQTDLKVMPDTSLLILSGIYLALLRQQQSAASH